MFCSAVLMRYTELMTVCVMTCFGVINVLCVSAVNPVCKPMSPWYSDELNLIKPKSNWKPHIVFICSAGKRSPASTLQGFNLVTYCKRGKYPSYGSYLEGRFWAQRRFLQTVRRSTMRNQTSDNCPETRWRMETWDSLPSEAVNLATRITEKYKK